MGKSESPEDLAVPVEVGTGTGHASLVIVQNTLVHFDSVAAGLEELARKYKDVVFAVNTTLGMAEAKLARASIRDPRIAVGKAIAAGKAPLNELKRVLDAKGLEITSALVELETPIHAQIKAEEDRKQAEKEVRDQAEAAALAVVQAQLDAMRDFVVDAAGQKAAQIQTTREALLDIVVTLEIFGDRAGEAMQTKATALAKLDDLLKGALEQEAAQASLAAAQKELADMRAANEAREDLARSAASAAQAVEAARQAQERATFDAERVAFATEQRIAREADEARIASDRQAEQHRIDEDQRQQREAAAIEQARLDQVATDARAEAERIAETARVEAKRIADEARAVEEAAQAAHQKVRNAAQTLLAALQGLIPYIDYARRGAEEAKDAACAAVFEATGEAT